MGVHLSPRVLAAFVVVDIGHKNVGKCAVVFVVAQQHTATTLHHLVARRIDKGRGGRDNHGERVVPRPHRRGEGVEKFGIARLRELVDDDGRRVESVFRVGVGRQALCKGGAVGAAALDFGFVGQIVARLRVEFEEALAHHLETLLCLVGTVGADVALRVGIAKQDIVNRYGSAARGLAEFTRNEEQRRAHHAARAFPKSINRGVLECLHRRELVFLQPRDAGEVQFFVEREELQHRDFAEPVLVDHLQEVFHPQLLEHVVPVRVVDHFGAVGLKARVGVRQIVGREVYSVEQTSHFYFRLAESVFVFFRHNGKVGS